MIDLIAFSLPHTATPQLKDIEFGWDGRCRGKYKNLNIVQYPEGIYCSGSIAKFLHGENVSTLSRKNVIEAISKLESETGWDLHKAELKQIEIGFTTPVNNHVGDYLKLWGRLPRNKLWTIQGGTIESVINSTGNRSFIAYDKGLEARGDIPPLFEGMNLLRMELKYKKQLKKFLGVCSPWEIVEKDFYKKLVDNFMSLYFQIPKTRQPVLDLSESLSPKDIDNFLKVTGFQCIWDNLLCKVNSLERSGKLTRADRVRKSLRVLSSHLNYTEPDELIKELDSKVIT